MMPSASVAALAAADFSALAARFAAAGVPVALPGPGMLQLGADPQRLSLLISVGVHGDETAPIELLAQLLATLAETPGQLAVNLLVVVGNPAAIALAKRFIDVDLNRLFRRDQGDLATAREAARAHQIMAAASAFFATGGARWHLDLHTAIRASRYPTFAIIPACIAPPQQRALTGLLGDAGIAAVILNPTSAGTFSAFTAEQLAATSATVELGQIGLLGDNELAAFAPAAATLALLLRSGVVAAGTATPLVFTVAQEIIKHSEAFAMSFDGSTQNFTALAKDQVIATDGAIVYRVQHDEELVVFPNPNVRVGHRAGLMVVQKQ
ncbi:succinylglutamate desuccinylase [Actimicrobium sp. GrIS 1.19]|uniref:succinylglutamate desuccinylase n=1 Tax=Actimicrobium sp. GrIS 1.19 TaxID=3071708 RepID=UPI002E089479|nr:succinylglutamate desuccinylase [Actimicrobium sp. GrIS 1.19]